MIAYVYKWTQLSTGKWYIGGRTKIGCHPDDGYICSSRYVKPLILANPTDWVRRIIGTGTIEQVKIKEAELLRFFDARFNPVSFNLHNGDGKFTTAGKILGSRSRAVKDAISAKNTGRVFSDEHIRKIKESRAKQIMKPASDERKLKISLANTGKKRTPEQRLKMSIAHLKEPTNGV
jgi:hypothetical protein